MTKRKRAGRFAIAFFLFASKFLLCTEVQTAYPNASLRLNICTYFVLVCSFSNVLTPFSHSQWKAPIEYTHSVIFNSKQWRQLKRICVCNTTWEQKSRRFFADIFFSFFTLHVVTQWWTRWDLKYSTAGAKTTSSLLLLFIALWLTTGK